MNKIPIRIRGIDYPSQSAAAKALGVSPSAIYARLEIYGTADGVGITPPGPKPKPIKIRGVVYPSQKAAAKALGVSVSAIIKAKRYGREVGLQRRSIEKAKGET